jgi:hypothetical protein
MKKSTKQLMLFKDSFGKKVQVDFQGGRVSSDGGWLLLREAEAEIGIVERMATALDDPRHPGYVKHHVIPLLKQRVFQIAAGYEDGNDSNTLREDPLLKLSCESTDPLASQPTMCRFENAQGKKALYRMAQVLLECFIDSYEEAPEGIVIDLDDTDDRVHGGQQLSLFNSYYGDYCYMPLHIYEGKSGKLITTILRPGKRPTGRETVSILKRIIRRIRQVWPEVGILIRADFHFSSPELFDYCQENNVNYIIGYTGYKSLLREAEGLLKRARELYESTGKPVRLYGECRYQAKSWSVPGRIIYKVEYNSQGSNQRFVVTNLSHSSRRFIYEDVYCSRGAVELMIKEHKNHMASDRTSCSGFLANQFRLFLHSMAYVLMHHFREKHLVATELARAQFNTIRLRLIKIGAQVRELSTRIKVHLPSSYPLQEEFWKIWQSCCQPGVP